MSLARHAVLAALLLTAVVGCKSETKKEPAPAAAAEPAKPLSVSRSARIVMSAQVKSLDYSTRWITLADSAGNSTSFRVSDNVQRLSEVKPGDFVKAECTATLVAELRPPTADERAKPIAIVNITGRAPKGSDPSHGTVTATRVVTTVQAVDLPNMLVTLKGPMGDVDTVRAENPENVKKIHVGDTIVITYVETVGISLVKVQN